VAPLLGLLFFLPLVYYGTHVRLRYRFPIEPALLMLAGYGLHELWRRLRGARRSSRPVTAGGQDPLPV
jgi:hypothetical protein